MAGLPIIDNRIVPPASAGAVTIDPRSAPGAIVAAGARQLFGAATEVSFQFLNAEVAARDSAELTKAIGDATRGLSEARIAAEKAPPGARVDKFAASTKALNERIKSSITNRRTRLRFDSRFTPLSESVTAGVRAAARSEEIEAARGQLIKTNDALVATALAARSTVERDIAVQQIRENIARAKNTGVLNEAGARAATAKALGPLAVHQAVAMIRANPAAAKTALGDARQFPDLTPVQRIKLVEAAEGRQRALVARAHAQVVSDMALMLKTAQGGAGTSPEAWKALRARAKPFGKAFVARVAAAEHDASFVAEFLKRSLIEQARTLQAMNALIGSAQSVGGVKALAGRTEIARKAFKAAGGPAALKKQRAALVARGASGLGELKKALKKQRAALVARGASGLGELKKALKTEGIAPKALIAATGRAILQAGDQALAVDFTRFLANVVFSNKFTKLPLDSQKQVMGALRDFAANAPTAAAASAALGRLELARKAHGDLKARSKKNPNATAAERKLVDFAPVFFSGTRQVPVAGSGGFAVITPADSFRTRIQTAKLISAKTGMPLKILDDVEILKGKALLERASPVRKLEIAAALVEGFGADAPRVFAELGLADAAFPAVGALVLAGRPGVAIRMMAGAEFRKNNPKAFQPGILAAVERKVLDTVAPLFPNIAGVPADAGGAATARLVEGITNVYINDARAGGKLAAVTVDAGLAKRAIADFTGGIVTVNGGKVIAAPGLSGGEMERVLRRATPAILASVTGSRPMIQFGGRVQPLPVERLREARLMSVAPGEYMLLVPGPNGGLVPVAREVLPSAEGGFTGIGEVPRRAAMRIKWAALAAAVGLDAIGAAGAAAGALAGAALAGGEEIPPGFEAGP